LAVSESDSGSFGSGTGRAPAAARDRDAVERPRDGARRAASAAFARDGTGAARAGHATGDHRAARGDLTNLTGRAAGAHRRGAQWAHAPGSGARTVLNGPLVGRASRDGSARALAIFVEALLLGVGARGSIRGRGGGARWRRGSGRPGGTARSGGTGSARA